MKTLNACVPVLLAALILAQTGLSNRPLMHEYHGLALVFVALLILAGMNFVSALNAD